jgi:hypothetical protein
MHVRAASINASRFVQVPESMTMERPGGAGNSLANVSEVGRSWVQEAADSH